MVLGLANERRNLHQLEVLRVQKVALERQDAFVVIGVARFEPDVALQELGIQNVLLEAHGPEVVARPRVQQDGDLGLISIEVDTHLALLHDRIEIALSSRYLDQGSFGFLVRGMFQRIPGPHTKFGWEGVVALSFADDPVVHTRYLEHGPRVDLVASLPDGGTVQGRLLQVRGHIDSIVTKRFQCLANLLGRLLVEPLDAADQKAVPVALLVDLQ